VADETNLDPLLHDGLKGFPSGHAALRASAVAAAGWNVLAGDLPLPVALIKREALEHNLAWMQQRVREWGIDLAPHGKTTMAPRLFRASSTPAPGASLSPPSRSWP
jgi:D-serine dehydratase